MRERGNLLGVRVATLQDPPALLDLEGDEANPVNRTYGTTGVITRVRLPLTLAIIDGLLVEIAARLREQKPSFDIARASPVRVVGGGGMGRSSASCRSAPRLF